MAVPNLNKANSNQDYNHHRHSKFLSDIMECQKLQGELFTAFLKSQDNWVLLPIFSQLYIKHLITG